MSTPERCQPKALTLERKCKLIVAVEAGSKSKTEITEDFGIPKGTLSVILSKRAKILRNACGSTSARKKMRVCGSTQPRLQAVLLLWVRAARAQNIPINRPLLRGKAELIATRSEYCASFCCNEGWLAHFRK